MKHPALGPGALGLAGSTLVAVAAWGSGAQPSSGPARWIGHVPFSEAAQRSGSTKAEVLFWCGIVVWLTSWVWLRSRVTRLRPRLVVALCLLWAAPLLAGPPLGSRDAYSYAATGALANRHLDPAVHPAAALGPGPLLASVDPLWRDTVSPYGPLSTAVARVADRLGNHRPAADVLALRAFAVAGYLLALLSAVSLARSCERDPTDAAVLVGANPLVVLQLVGGLHNESLMIGLMMAGLAICARRREIWVWAAAVCLVALATAMKAPAALALVWLAWYGPAWVVARASSPLRRAGNVLSSMLITVLLFTAINRVTGVGWDWVKNLDVGNRVMALLSVTTTIGIAVGRLCGAGTRHALSGYVTTSRRIGQAVSAGFAAWLLLHRGSRLAHLGAALAITAALSPVVYPWYMLWGMVPLAVAWSGTSAAGYVVGSIALCFSVHPYGSAISGNLASSSHAFGFRLLAVGAVAALAFALWRHLSRFNAHDSQPIPG